MENNNLVFGKTNYILMLSGILLLVIGFWLMTFTTADYGQGGTEMTLGPIIVALGFLVEIAAILYKKKEVSTDDEQS